MTAKPPKQAATTSTHAVLSSFYIFNPSLGTTDSTVHDQLIFHYSALAPKASSPKSSATAPSATEGQDLDRQLRAIGLAQGIVEFARAFSPDSPVQEVRTQKGFTVPLEIEKRWWMLAVSIMDKTAADGRVSKCLIRLLLIPLHPHCYVRFYGADTDDNGWNFGVLNIFIMNTR